MELISTLKTLHEKLSGYGFTPEAEQELGEYLLMLRQREDLLALAQQYHDDVFENKTYTMAQIEELPENDGQEKGLLFAAIFLARYEQMVQVYAPRGIDEAHKTRILEPFKLNLQKNKNRYGYYGLKMVYRNLMVGYLMPDKFLLGRLCFEISKFNNVYAVYRNKMDGSTLPLALPGYHYMKDGRRKGASYTGETFEPTLEKTEEEIRGYTFDDNGRLVFAPLTLKAAEYEEILSPGDDVISVHIPSGGRLTPELSDDAFARAEVFFKEHYPEKHFKAYVCGSWMLDTDLKSCLSPSSNILAFQSKYRVVLTSENTYSLNIHIFGVDESVPLENLVPANKFQQTMLDRRLAGIPLYHGYGYILKDN